MLRRLPVLLLIFLAISFSSAFGKNLREAKLQGMCTVEEGKPANLDALKQEVDQINFESDHYLEIVGDPTHGVIGDPTKVKNDQDVLAVLQAREIFVLVDQSGTMSLPDDDPRGDHMMTGVSSVVPMATTPWTRWDSARIAAEGLAEISLTLDRDGMVPVYFFSGKGLGSAEVTKVEASSVNEITNAFNNKIPKGTTPLANALQKVYEEHLKDLLTKSEPFTVIILTDGVPDERNKVIDFFSKIVTTHKLATAGREHLAAFTFIQMGDDKGADQYLTLLDDKLKPALGVDIIDTKKDNFIFGTDPKYKNDCGPLAVLRDAVFD